MAGMLLALCLGMVILAHGQQSRVRAAPPAEGPPRTVEVSPVQGKVYVLTGAGGNITLQIGDEGVLMVDTGLEGMSESILSAIRKLSAQPIRYIINTHMHDDHTGGNAKISKAGSNITSVSNFMRASGEDAAPAYSHDNVLLRMTAPVSPSHRAIPFAQVPTDTFTGEQEDTFMNGEGIQMFHEIAAHTDGDITVFFRKSDVIATGDVFVTAGFPVIDLANGGTIQGVIKGLNHIIDLTIPADNQEGGTYVIPGHGRACDEADVVDYRDMVSIVFDRIRDLVKKGRTIEQIKAAKPTLDYDFRYGRDRTATDAFVEAVFKNITTKP